MTQQQPGPPAGYSAAQKWLHWLMAVLILGMIPMGFTMVDLPDGPDRNWVYELHKSVGMTVFVLAVIRVAVRVARGAPPLPAGMPGWQRAAANLSHAALYVLIVAVPVLGFIGTSMCCSPVKLFNTITVPIALPGGMETGKVVLAVHGIAVFAMAGILVAHVGGALMHAIVQRDGVFQRMLPGRD